jgi:initiation factor 1A
MPNLKGGKKYKSSKHQDDKAEMHEIDKEQGQDIARVLRPLGNCNMLLLCNDGTQRLGHIRRAIKKGTRILTGDIVLYSVRSENLGSNTECKSKLEKTDILAKYAPELYSKLKKVDGVNAQLFEAIDQLQRNGLQIEEGGFEFDAEASDGEDGSSTNSEEREASKAAKEKKRSAARDAKATLVGDDGDIDIDAI